MNNLFCATTFPKIFPGSLFLKNSPLLWRSEWRMDKIPCAPTSPWSPSRDQNQSSKLLIIKQKWNSTYLVHICNLLTSAMREVRKNSKENLQLLLGLQGSRSLQLIAFIFLSILCFVGIACKSRCDSGCSFLATDSQRDALADKAQAYLFP